MDCGLGQYFLSNEGTVHTVASPCMACRPQLLKIEIPPLYSTWGSMAIFSQMQNQGASFHAGMQIPPTTLHLCLRGATFLTGLVTVALAIINCWKPHLEVCTSFSWYCSRDLYMQSNDFHKFLCLFPSKIHYQDQWQNLPNHNAIYSTTVTQKNLPINTNSNSTRTDLYFSYCFFEGHNKFWWSYWLTVSHVEALFFKYQSNTKFHRWYSIVSSCKRYMYATVSAVCM